MDKTCFKCGCHFYPTRSDQIYCSPKCRYDSYHNGLTLPIKKKWFDMILSGEKKEEYREIKPYWTTRFNRRFGQFWNFEGDNPVVVWSQQPRIITFKNGYQKNARQFEAECTIREDYGKEMWGAETGVKYYVLTIRNILKKEN